MTVPYSALLDDGGRAYVFVVAKGIARHRDGSPARTTGDFVQILAGLEPGERIVTEGGTALDDGVKVHEERSPPPAGSTK